MAIVWPLLHAHTATADDAYWDDAIGSPGLNRQIDAMVDDGNGHLYVGGRFTTVNGVTASRIAKWDGTDWSALGSGMDRSVQALALDNNGNLYAGGNFSTADGVNTSRIARWNGSNWSALGSGVNNLVSAIAVDGIGNVYAAGNFTFAGSTPTNYVAKWDGSNWTALGTGVDRTIHALVLDNDGNLYAGGNFTRAGSANSNGIARWDGSNWSAVGTGPGFSVRSLAIDNSTGKLYAGGNAGSTSTDNIAVWDGTSWSTVGNGVSGIVYALKFDDSGNLYAAGSFTSAGGISANRIAKWDGNSWSPLGSGIEGIAVTSLELDKSGNLYTGGWFTEAGTNTSQNIARWISPQRQLPINEWGLFSLSAIPPADQNTVEHILGDDISAPYGNWAVYGFDTDANTYYDVGAQGTLAYGNAYWLIQLSGEAVTIDMPAGSQPPAMQISTACTSIAGCFNRTLNTNATGSQWNTIGNPFSSSPPVSSIRITTANGDCSVVNGCSLLEAETANIHRNSFWQFDGTRYLEITTEDHFNPWQGYWGLVLPGAHDNDSRLLIPAE